MDFLLEYCVAEEFWISFSNVLDFFLICFGFLVIAGYERPVENNANLEADPDVHQAVEDDETGKGKLEIWVFVVFDKIDKSDNWSTEISLESDINICPSELG